MERRIDRIVGMIRKVWKMYPYMSFSELLRSVIFTPKEMWDADDQRLEIALQILLGGRR